MVLKMDKHNVVVFRSYPFEVGQKLHIEGGPRNGDWEVIGVSDRKVKLRCPVSLREFEWNRHKELPHLGLRALHLDYQ